MSPLRSTCGSASGSARAHRNLHSWSRSAEGGCWAHQPGQPSLCWDARLGIRPMLEGKRVGHGPRLQDLRHTFTTRRLMEWYRSGVDVAQRMPALSTYLGHAGVQHTYWYVQAVPELLALAAEHGAAVGGGR